MPFILINGKQIEVDDAGHLKNSYDWNEDVARFLAAEQRIILTELHWKIINYTRKNFLIFSNPYFSLVLFLEMLKKKCRSENMH